jgi:hypothetical protein
MLASLPARAQALRSLDKVTLRLPDVLAMFQDDITKLLAATDRTIRTLAYALFLRHIRFLPTYALGYELPFSCDMISFGM